MRCGEARNDSVSVLVAVLILHPSVLDPLAGLRFKPRSSGSLYLRARRCGAHMRFRPVSTSMPHSSCRICVAFLAPARRSPPIVAADAGILATLASFIAASIARQKKGRHNGGPSAPCRAAISVWRPEPYRVPSSSSCARNKSRRRCPISLTRTPPAEVLSRCRYLPEVR